MESLRHSPCLGGLGMTPAQCILDRLEGVRQHQSGNYSARCPAHSDRDPSLSIREESDGRVLLHCHAGCSTESVLAAVGLSSNDLFHSGSQPRRPPPAPGVSHRQLQDATEIERSILFILKCDARKSKAISQNDIRRGHLAQKRIAMAKGVL